MTPNRHVRLAIVAVITLAAPLGAFLVACGHSANGACAGSAVCNGGDAAAAGALPDSGAVSSADAGSPDSATLAMTACTLDTTFGDGGAIFAPFATQDGGSGFFAALIQGSALLALQYPSFDAKGRPGAVTRYLLDGTPDPSFNGGAPVTLSFGTGTDENLVGALTQSDGKIVVFGYSFHSDPDSHSRTLVARLNPDGTLDTAFGNGGMVVGPAPQPSTSPGAQLAAGTERPNGTLTFSGWSSPALAWTVTRLTAAGALDLTFADSGTSIASSPDSGGPIVGTPTNVAIDSTGGILALGSIDNSTPSSPTVWGVARFAPSGGLDPSYASGGFLYLGAVPHQLGLVSTNTVGLLDQADRLTVATGGSSDAGALFFAARVTPNGIFDNSFNAGKMLAIPLGLGDTWLQDMVVAPDGKLVLVGPGPKGGIAVVRLGVDGTPDTSCGQQGVATIYVPWTPGGRVSATFDGAGRLLLASSGSTSTSSWISFARVWM